jgi:ribosomal protein S18 acetylase RimI-like enzyme
MARVDEGYSIRPLESEDRDQIVALVSATGNFSEAEVAIAKELIDICIEQPDQKDYYTFVAEANASGHSHVAGFLLLGPTPATTGTFDMYWIAVHPDFQGKGIAQQLDRFAEEFVISRTGYLLIAETSSMPSYDRTRAFYTKQGYEIMARIQDYYKPFDDLVIYGKRLSANVS